MFAADKHSAQRRKGAAAEPYINHLIEVAHLVSTTLSEPDINLVVAALLHDVIEDAGVTSAELTERFGQDVAALVLEVTDDKSLPKEERKRLQIEHAPKLKSGMVLCRVVHSLFLPIENRRCCLRWHPGPIRQGYTISQSAQPAHSAIRLKPASSQPFSSPPTVDAFFRQRLSVERR